jgi:hypothetical protein
MPKEAHKVYLDNQIWELLTKMADLEGVSIGDLIARLLMDKYHWKLDNNNNNTATKPKTNIKELLQKAIIEGAIPKEEYRYYIVLYCKECLYIDIRSRYGIAPWLCDQGHKLELLGTLNTMV